MNTRNKSLRVVFMGTPDFAVASLEAIHASRHSVEAVVTVPDKPAGRGRRITFSAVKRKAGELSLPLLQPQKLSDPEFIGQIESLRPDVIVVVAFRMLPEQVWKVPASGTFNLHASLLPQYRGAAPINRAIMNGETVTGVTTFFIDHQIDTGSIILQEKLTVGSDETAGELHDRMMVTGASLVVKTLDLIADDTARPQPQVVSDDIKLHTAPKIYKEETPIDWSIPAVHIHNKIRGLSPVPAAVITLLHNERGMINLRVFRSRILPPGDATPDSLPALLTDGRSYLHILLPDAVLTLDEVQLEGRKRMPVSDFLRGFSIDANWKPV
jgi:methionyl-tRNA formyltransferase